MTPITDLAPLPYDVLFILLDHGERGVLFTIDSDHDKAAQILTERGFAECEDESNPLNIHVRYQLTDLGLRCILAHVRTVLERLKKDLPLDLIT